MTRYVFVDMYETEDPDGSKNIVIDMGVTELPVSQVSDEEWADICYWDALGDYIAGKE